ncbi:hypothetical protein CROQUDRAFT_674445 [Cronartium quercuum f. sp. fusiforme G11]|uniref:Uncharacterized protein n=1 Tax=Cronartium quercuum f. sp. fusiforme G11 TaxID=708437 RepID=A0A9P6T6A6_9BASI|nr:hypothetical protein CROQUDRAFT_674445 [Cronartium quercuum f. sp. fusiforme G11]
MNIQGFRFPTSKWVICFILFLIFSMVKVQSQSPGFQVVCCDQVNDICGGPIERPICKRNTTNTTVPYVCLQAEEGPICPSGSELDIICVSFGKVICKTI